MHLLQQWRIICIVLIGGTILCSASFLLPPDINISRLQPPASRQCNQDFQALQDGLNKNYIWALTMWDASVKSPVGLLSNTQVQFGDFEGCLTVTEPVTAQYCLVDMKVNNQLLSSFRWGLCLPASCTSKELEVSLQNYMDSVNSSTKVSLNPKACSSIESTSIKLSSGDIIFCLVIATICIILALATLQDVWQNPHYDGVSRPKSLRQCLSLRHGWYTLFNPNHAANAKDLPYVHGLHAVTICLIIGGHRFYTHYMIMHITNYRQIENILLNSWVRYIIVNCLMIIDWTFFLSSFLLAYSYFPKLEKTFVNPLRECLCRARRLLPEYAVLVFFYATMLRHMGYGPLWNEYMENEKAFCVKNWWTNLLFVNNYIGNDEMCMYHSWYISSDLHMFIIGTMFVILLHYNSVLGLVSIGLVSISCSLLTFRIISTEDFPPLLFVNKECITDIRHNIFFNAVQIKSQYRLTSCLPGLLAGYVSFKFKNYKLSQRWTNVIQALGFTIIGLVLTTGALFYVKDQPPNRFWRAMFASLYRYFLGFGIALTMLSGFVGQATPLRNFLSWRGFQPIAKLTYGVYLVHEMLQICWVASRHTPVQFTFWHWLMWAVCDITASLAIALLLKLTIELPVSQLFTYFQTGTYSSKCRNEDTLKNHKPCSAENLDPNKEKHS